MRTLKTVTTAGALLGAIALAGCGGSTGGGGATGESSKDPQTIIFDAASATKAAKDAHIKAVVADTTIDGDLGGSNFDGTAQVKGKTFGIVVLADSSGDASKAKVYMKATSDVWAGFTSSTAATCVGGKWLEVDAAANPDSPSTATLSQSAQQIASGVSSLADLRTFGASLTSDASGASKGGVQDIGGQQAVEIKSASSGSIFVAETGTPNLLRVTSTGSSAGQIDFTKWNSGVSFNAPSGADSLVNVASSCAPAAAAAPTP